MLSTKVCTYLCTDLGSLNGNFDCVFHCTVWNPSNFLATLTILRALNFDFWKNLTLENVKTPKNSKFTAAQKVKMADFGASKYPNDCT